MKTLRSTLVASAALVAVACGSPNRSPDEDNRVEASPLSVEPDVSSNPDTASGPATPTVPEAESVPGEASVDDNSVLPIEGGKQITPPRRESMSTGGASGETQKSKRGISGFGLFIQARLAELRVAGTPYTGSRASEDFAEEWGSLSQKERDEYNQQSTDK